MAGLISKIISYREVIILLQTRQNQENWIREIISEGSIKFP